VHSRRALALALALLCCAAFPAHASAKGCKAKQIALADRHAGKVTTWCLPRPPLPKTQADATVAIGRLLGAGKLTPKRLDKLVPRMKASAERAFGVARDAQLRRATVAAQAARDGTSQGPIAPGPGQAGDGYSSEGTKSSTEEDAEHATVHKTHTSKMVRTAFGPACPDFDGNVVTNISIVLTDIRTEERRGKRTTIDTEAKITGTLKGGFTDEFEYRGPLQLDLDFVIETRVSTSIAATGKQIGREPTSTRRVKLTEAIDGNSLGKLVTPIQSLSDTTITGAAGPHGPMTIKDFEGDTPLMGTLVGLNWIAKLLGETAFGKTVSNAAEFGCVAATADPASLTLANGESASFTVTIHGLDDQRPLPSSNNTRVYSGNLTMSPLGTKLHGPASGIAFQLTSGGGKSVAEVVTVSRRGYAPTLRIPVDEKTGFPKQFTGTWTRVYSDPTFRDGYVQTIHGTATFVRNPLIPAAAEGLIAIPYDLASSTITWTVTGSRFSSPCTTIFSGTGTDTATENTFVGSGMTLQAVGGTYYYSLRASSYPIDAPLFDINVTGNGCTSHTQEPIIVNYLEIGSRSDFDPNTPADELETSSSITLLEGSNPNGTPGFPDSTDTWSFKGSY
jgi:hypothetical protein